LITCKCTVQTEIICYKTGLIFLVVLRHITIVKVRWRNKSIAKQAVQHGLNSRWKILARINLDKRMKY